MASALRIKRRAAGGAAGAPSSLLGSELAFNEQDNTLYYGKGDSGGNATSVIPIAGSGAFVQKAGDTMTGNLSVDAGTDTFLNVGDDVQSVVDTQNGIRFTAFNNGSDYFDFKTFSGGFLQVRGVSGAAASVDLMRFDPAAGTIQIQPGTASTSPTTGALTVAGGLGVSANIYTAASLNVNNSGYGNINFNDGAGTGLWAAGTEPGHNFVILATGIATWVTVNRTAGNVQIASSAASTSPTTGALTVAGGVGIAKGLCVGVPGASAMAPQSAAIQVAYVGAGGVNGISLRANADAANPLAFFNASGGVAGYITCTATTTSYVTTSDRALKTDLQPFDAAAIIDAITVYDFAWIATNERAHGVIAQEAIQIYPEAVTHDEAVGVWGVDYSKFVPLLLQEIKDLRARVAQLEARR